MLKLERVDKSRQIHISVRKKNRFFTKTLCWGIIYALSFHLLILLLFHVAPFHINYADSLFPPVAVASDLGRVLEGNTTAFLEENIFVPPHLLLPLRQDPFSRLRVSEPANNRLFPNEESIAAQPFLAAEWAHLKHGQVPLDRAPSPLFTVQVSGPLGGFGYQKLDPPTLPSCFQPIEKTEFVFSFDVRADGLTGKIIWLTPKMNEEEEMLRWAENIIQSMQFYGTDLELMISGTVEMFIRRGIEAAYD